MNHEIVESFSQMVREKRIDKDMLVGIIEEVFAMMVKKKYGQDVRFDVVVNMDKGDIEIYLEKATLVYESGTSPLTLLTPPQSPPSQGGDTGGVEQVKLQGGDDATTAFTLEIQAAVDSIQKGKEHDYLSGKLARDALVLCHKECESVRTGRAVAVV